MFKQQTPDGSTFYTGMNEGAMGTRWGVTSAFVYGNQPNVPVEFGDGGPPRVGDLVVSNNALSKGSLMVVRAVVSNTRADLDDNVDGLAFPSLQGPTGPTGPQGPPTPMFMGTESSAATLTLTTTEQIIVTKNVAIPAGMKGKMMLNVVYDFVTNTAGTATLWGTTRVNGVSFVAGAGTRIDAAGSRAMPSQSFVHDLAAGNHTITMGAWKNGTSGVYTCGGGHAGMTFMIQLEAL